VNLLTSVVGQSPTSGQGRERDRSIGACGLRLRDHARAKNPEIARVATRVVNAAYHAVGDGLHEVLLIPGVLLLVGAVVATVTVRQSGGEAYEL
jgi:hypothetical protein